MSRTNFVFENLSSRINEFLNEIGYIDDYLFHDEATKHYGEFIEQCYQTCDDDKKLALCKSINKAFLMKMLNEQKHFQKKRQEFANRIYDLEACLMENSISTTLPEEVLPSAPIFKFTETTKKKRRQESDESKPHQRGSRKNKSPVIIKEIKKHKKNSK
jgi:hypothetical protein